MHRKALNRKSIILNLSHFDMLRYHAPNYIPLGIYGNTAYLL